jgi:hypothetical protein
VRDFEPRAPCSNVWTMRSCTTARKGTSILTALTSPVWTRSAAGSPTPLDLARFIAKIEGGILNPETVSAMTTPSAVNPTHER